MDASRSKNAKRNLIYGFLNQIFTTLLPFAVRTVIIKMIGEQYLGLNGLFSSILSVLSLAELGFGSAVIYNMYKPVAEGDTATICALLNFYRRIYRIVGCIVLGVGLALIPFLPKLIHGSYPSDINLTAVYLIYLCNAGLSYFLYAYLSSVLIVYQRNDIRSKLGIITTTGLNVVQITAVCLTKNYYLFAMLLPISTVVYSLLSGYIVRKKYPELKCEGELSLELTNDIRRRVSGLMIGKLCGVSRNAFDSIFVSSFIGLTATAIYNNYFYIINAVTAFLAIISTSVTAGVGNSVAVETPEKNYSDMNRMNFGYLVISGWCAVCILCLTQPFMIIWVGDKLMFPFPAVVMFVLYFYVLKMGDIRTIYVETNGLWWENRFRSIAEALCNIILNYILGKLWGVYGIIIATLISLFVINFCYGSTIVFRHYFKKQKVSEYYLSNALYFGVTSCIAGATYWVCSLIQLSPWPTLILRAAICCVVPTSLYLMAYFRYPFGREATKWLVSKIR